jgi:hypothetical protein
MSLDSIRIETLLVQSTAELTRIAAKLIHSTPKKLNIAGAIRYPCLNLCLPWAKAWLCSVALPGK